MFCLHTALRNIQRQKIKSLLGAGICLVIVLFLSLYLGNIESSQRQLETLPDAMPVYGRVMNLNGTREVGLNISEGVLTQLEKSPFVKDLVYTDYLKGGIGEFAQEDWKENLVFPVLATNSIRSASGMEPGHIRLKAGETLEFLTISSPKCLVSKEAMEDNQWEIGDKIPLNVYYYRRPSVYELYLDPLELMSVEIVGVMETSSFVAEGESLDILVPVGLIKESYKKKELMFLADSLFFYLKDPLLLNEFKASLKEETVFRLLPIIPTAEDNISGNALALRDASFIEAATRLRQGLRVLNGFLPTVFGLVIFLGYVAAYLLVQSRRKEIFIMRCAGMSPGACFRVFLAEQGILVIGSWLLGRLIFMPFAAKGSWLTLGMTVVLCLCYLLGTVAALWWIVKKSVMEIRV